jgi:hypothetical protein
MCYLNDEQLKCPEVLPITYLFAPQTTHRLARSGRWADRWPGNRRRSHSLSVQASSQKMSLSSLSVQAWRSSGKPDFAVGAIRLRCD